MVKSKWGKSINKWIHLKRQACKQCDKICVYDKHPIAGWDLQFRAPGSQSEYATPFKDIT